MVIGSTGLLDYYTTFIRLVQCVSVSIRQIYALTASADLCNAVQVLGETVMNN